MEKYLSGSRARKSWKRIWERLSETTEGARPLSRKKRRLWGEKKEYFGW